MKRVLIAVAIAALSLSGCNGLGNLGFPDGTVPAVGSQTTLDEKAMIGLERTAIALNVAASEAVDAGVLTPGSPRAIQVADLLVTVRQTVLAARQAYNAGDAPTAVARTNAALGLIGQVYGLIAG